MSMERLNLVSKYINGKFSKYTLIDLGCRTRDLLPLLDKCDEYIGTDYESSENVVACDLEGALPFEDNSFDIVCCLDVLEHLENVHGAISEIKRVAKTAAIISLPNIAHWTFRLRFLTKGYLSGKYIFHDTPVIDRHRWVTNYSDSKIFITNNFGVENVEFFNVLPTRNRTKIISEPIENWLSKLFPNMFVYGLVAVIHFETENN